MGLKLEQNVQTNNAQPGSGAVRARRPYAAMEFAPGTQFPDYVTVVGNSVPVGFINYLPHSAQSNYHAGYLRLREALLGRAELVEFVHVLEGHHQRSAVPQRRRRQRRGKLAAARLALPARRARPRFLSRGAPLGELGRL
jgi:hypothetical protein